jgi:hypothetical protein
MSVYVAKHDKCHLKLQLCFSFWDLRQRVGSSYFSLEALLLTATSFLTWANGRANV